MDDPRRLVPMLAWIAGLVVVLAGAAAMGHGGLATPDVLHPGTWSEWATTRTAPEAAVAIVRLIVVLLSAYLLVATLVAVALRLGEAGRLVTAADVLTLPFVRSIVQAGLGVGIAGATVAGVVAHPVSMRPPTSADEAPVLQAADDDPPPAAASGHQEVRIPDRSVTRTWTVAPGEHFWSIAERVVGPGRSEDEVAAYWHALVEANRDVLADRDNPDLLFPGQVLSLPSGA